MPGSTNKHLQLLDQGLAAYVYERENDIPLLTDNPLMLAPWRDDLEDYIGEIEPAFSTLVRGGFLLNSKGGYIFSTYKQATPTLLPI